MYFIHDGDTPLLVLVAGPTDHGPRQKLQVEVVAARAEDAQGFLSELTETIQRNNIYRGQVISLSPGRFGPGPHTLIAFHALPRVDRENVILPDGVLERIERHTIVFAEHSERLLAAGRSLKRGLLLFGPPGVGKTLTVQYLSNRMQGRTVLLTTGLGMGFLRPVVQLARTLAPSMVVLEDVDLIAEERGMPGGHAGPLLFELLNEMDGLQEDRDIIFILTTNRPENPGTGARRAARQDRPGGGAAAPRCGRPAPATRAVRAWPGASGCRSGCMAERIDGATPAYIKELLRKAAVLAATEDAGPVVTGAHLEAAAAELDEGGELAHSLLRAAPRTRTGRAYCSPPAHGPEWISRPGRVAMRSDRM